MTNISYMIQNALWQLQTMNTGTGDTNYFSMVIVLVLGMFSIYCFLCGLGKTSKNGGFVTVMSILVAGIFCYMGYMSV